MLEVLEDAVVDLELPVCLEALAEVIAVRDRLDARIAELAGAVDEAQLWELHGHGSLKGWLIAHARMSGRDAGRLAATSRRMRAHPVTSAAWRDGEVSSGQVDVIGTNVKPYAVDLFAEHEAALLPELAPLSVADTVIAMHDWVQNAEAVLDPRPDDDHDGGELFMSRAADGAAIIKGTLDPQGAQLVQAALRVAMTNDPEDGPTRTWGHKRHDAFVDVCKFYLDNQNERAGGSHRPHLNVIVTHDELVSGVGGRWADGSAIDAVTMSALRCDCNVHRLLVDATNTRIDYGRATKTISTELRTVLIARDRGCRFPDCDRLATFCDGHHAQWWRSGGETDQANLVLLCRAHHRTLHKPGWHAKLEPGGTLTVTYPDQRTRSTRPPGLEPPQSAA